MLLLSQVSRLVRENLTNRALRFNIVLDDVSITHVAFSPEFTHAVEAKQVCLSLDLLDVYPSSLYFQGRTTNSAARSILGRSSHPRETSTQNLFMSHLSFLLILVPLSQLSSKHLEKLKVQN
jgi:hypothetical protein